jgi:hypothetical protein
MCVTAPLSEFCRGNLIFYDPFQKARRRDGSTGWPDVMMLTFGPIITSSAMSSPPRSQKVQFWFTKTLRPILMSTPPAVQNGGINKKLSSTFFPN